MLSPAPAAICIANFETASWNFKIWVISFSYIDWVNSPRSTGHFLQMAICVPGALPVSDYTSTPPVNVSIQWSECLVQIFALLVPSSPALILLATRQKTLIGYIQHMDSLRESFLVGLLGYYLFSYEMARGDSLIYLSKKIVWQRRPHEPISQLKSSKTYSVESSTFGINR